MEQASAECLRQLGQPMPHARLVRGWSMRHLARQSGGSHPQVLKVEAGPSNTLSLTLPRLAEALAGQNSRCLPADIFSRDRLTFCL